METKPSDKYEWQWTVIDDAGGINSGIVSTFDEAVKAIRNWFGYDDEYNGEPDLMYQILRIPKRS